MDHTLAIHSGLDSVKALQALLFHGHDLYEALGHNQQDPVGAALTGPYVMYLGWKH